MASRDIAGMHLFFEMKRVFPELPEDVIRKTVHEWPNDCKQCIYHLKKEREKFQFYKESFSEYLSSLHVNRKNYHNATYIKLQQDVCGSASGVKDNCSLKKEPEQVRKQEKSKLSKKVIFVDSHVNHQLRSNCLSADINTKKQVFSSRHKNNTKPGFSSKFSSFPSQFQHENNFVKASSAVNENKYVSFSDNLSKTSPKQHKVTLSFIPSPPCSQRTILPESTICASASPMSGSRRHMTSIHLELQPDTLNMPAVKISTAANSVSVASPQNKQKYDSCIHISFTSLGTTFSAQRTKIFSEISSPGDSLNNIDNSEVILTNTSTARNVSMPSSLPSRTSISVRNREKDHSRILQNKLSFPEAQNAVSVHCLQSKNLSANTKTHNLGDVEDSTTHGNLSDKNRNNIQPYVQAVLHHQKLRLEILKKEFESDRILFWQLNNEVNQIEQLLQASSGERNNPPNLLKMIELKEENEKLKEDCRKLFNELRKIEKRKEIYAEIS